MLDGGHGFELDIDAVNQNIGESEVVSLYFPLLQKTLLVDTRSSDEVGPLVAVVEMVDSTAQRFRSVRRLRPQFQRPESITMIPWVLRVGSLRRTGVWGTLTERLKAYGDPGCVEAAERCLEDLQGLERREVERALTGDQYHTVWGRRGVAEDADPFEGGAAK